MIDKEEKTKGKEEEVVKTFETNPDGDNKKTPGKKKPPTGG